MTDMQLTPTELRLMALYNAAAVRLDVICDTYLGLSPAVARKHALNHQLPFPAYRASASTKAPLLVNIQDLAAHLDRARAQSAQSVAA